MLRFKYAFNKNNPIMNSSQMLDDIKVEVDEVDEVVEDTANEYKSEAIFNGASPNFIKSLEDKLCSFGGELLCYDLDDYDELIFEHGQLWYGEILYHEQMQIGNCHGNTIQINDETPEHPIVVGYALSEYGFWFVHTWSLVEEPKENRTYVLETTIPSVLYFGVVLTKSQSIDFKNKYRRKE